MKGRVFFLMLTVVLFTTLSSAQLDHIVIAAGTPEDQALQESSKETDPQKKLALYQDFVQKFSANPAAVAYGNWQISQYYQNAGDLPKALEYGDKALAASPHNLDILVSQAGIAQQMKDDGKIMGYAEKGGLAYESIGKAGKPASITKAAAYSQKVIGLAKADQADADRSRKLSAGVAHSTLGYAYMKQDKTAAAVPEFKSATALLKGQDETAYALALYRLGFAYAKMSKTTEAREALNEAVKIAGPLQQPSRELLEKVNSARAKGK